jgi:UDP-N-acetylmuramate--alanine ligase
MKAGVNVRPERLNDYTVYSYGLDTEASFSARDITVSEGLMHFDFVHPGGILEDLVAGLPGRFNLENATAAMAAALLAGVAPGDLRKALRTYQGVQRRFDFRIRRDDLVYIDDYAHHPEELRACISAVRDLYPGKRITGIFQPHLFSRTRDLADDFARSLELLDELLLLDIYPAREKPIEGVTSAMLLEKVALQHKILVQKTDVLHELGSRRPEILLTLGAGDIDQLVGPITETLSSPERT